MEKSDGFHIAFFMFEKNKDWKKEVSTERATYFPIARSYCERREETWLLFTLQQNRRENYVSIFTNSKRDRKRNSGFARKSTVEVEVAVGEGILGLEGHMGRAQVPSGASTGKFEALEKRDREVRYLGRA